MSVLQESLVGLSFIVCYLAWSLTHWHQRATHPTDLMVILGLVGACISLHSTYRRIAKQSR